MANDSIIVLNVPQVADALKRYPHIAAPEYQAATEASLLGISAELAQYPPQSMGTSYDRTGQLGRLWTAAHPEFKAMSTGFEGMIGNNRPGGQYVQSAENQAWMHKGRWKTDKKVAESQKERIEGNYKAAAKRIEDKINQVTK